MQLFAEENKQSGTPILNPKTAVGNLYLLNCLFKYKKTLDIITDYLYVRNLYVTTCWFTVARQQKVPHLWYQTCDLLL